MKKQKYVPFLLLLCVVVVLSIAVWNSEALQDGRLLRVNLPAGGSDLVGTTDSVSGSTTIALAHSDWPKSFYTGELEHPCPLDSNVYGVDDYDKEDRSIIKGQMMHWSYDKANITLKCDWMKAWPVHRDFLEMPASRSYSTVNFDVDNVVFVSSRLSSDITADSFDFQCADTTKSVVNKGDHFLMKVHGDIGQCLWVIPVPPWYSKATGLGTGSHVTSKLRVDDARTAEVYIANANSVQGTELKYGPFSYTVKGNTGRPEAFMVAFHGNGEPKWLKALDATSSGTVTSSLITSFKPNFHSHNLILVAYLTASTSSFQYDAFDNQYATFHGFPTTAGRGRYIVMIINPVFNGQPEAAAAHVGTLSNDKSLYRSEVASDDAQDIYVAIPFQTDGGNQFTFDSQSKQSCSDFTPWGETDIAVIKLNGYTAKCKWVKYFASSGNDELYSLTYGKGQNPELFGKMRHSTSIDSVTIPAQPFRVRLTNSNGALQSLVPAPDAFAYAYKSVLYSNSDFVASGVHPGSFTLFMVHDKCLPGNHNADGTEAGNGQCTQCEAGTISDVFGRAFCMPCPTGQYQDVPGQTSCKICTGANNAINAERTTCGPCATGTYRDGLKCLKCPKGHYQDQTGETTCKSCAEFADNAYQDQTGQATCIACIGGSVNNERTTCSFCGIGTFNAVGSQCSKCPKGQYQDKLGQAECKKCDAAGPPNWYQDQEGQAQCMVCNVAGRAVNTGRTACEPCSSGSYSSKDGSQCIPCPVGHVQDGTGENSCIPCRTGYYQDKTGQTACIPCPVGHFQAIEGSTTCKLCDANNFRSDAYQDQVGQEVCKICGMYRIVNAERTMCESCSAGTFVRNNGGVVQCEPCPVGQYQDKEGEYDCINCGLGTYQDQTGQSSCVSCGTYAPNAYQDQEGQSSCKLCQDNRKGVDEERTLCSYCPAGRYNANGEPCAKCPAGHYAAQIGQTKCEKCPPGRFQNIPGYSYCFWCSGHDINAFQPLEGMDKCEYCPAGSHVDVDRVSCTKCAVNTYSHDGAKCYPCPAGYKQELEGQTSCVIDAEAGGDGDGDGDAGATGGGEGGGASALDVGLGVGLGVGIPVLLVVAAVAVVGFIAGVAAVTMSIVATRRRRQNALSKVDGNFDGVGGDASGGGLGKDIALEEISVPRQPGGPGAVDQESVFGASV